MARVSLLFLLLLISGCADNAQAPSTSATHSGPTSTESASPTEEPKRVVNGFPVVADPLTLKLPIESYLPSGPGQRAFNTAQTMLVNGCLGRYGFSSEPLPSTWTAADDLTRSLTALRYGLFDLAAARKYGFRTGLRPEWVDVEKRRLMVVAQQQAIQQREGNARTDSRGLVENGIDVSGHAVTDFGGQALPKNGCVGEALNQLGGFNDFSNDSVAQEIQRSSWDESKADPRVQRVLGQWSACMKTRGFTAIDPLAINNQAWPGTTPGAREKAAAVGTVQCSLTANVLGVWFGVETEVENRMVDKQAEHLAEVRAGIRMAESAAARVLEQAQ